MSFVVAGAGTLKVEWTRESGLGSCVPFKVGVRVPVLGRFGRFVEVGLIHQLGGNQGIFSECVSMPMFVPSLSVRGR